MRAAWFEMWASEREGKLYSTVLLLPDSDKQLSKEEEEEDEEEDG